MKERGILFSAPMVRAILDGSKTQTRRIIKGFDVDPTQVLPTRDGRWICGSLAHTGYGDTFDCPYGVPEDRLWVRETFRYHPEDLPLEMVPVDYKATPFVTDAWDGIPWRPSLHMPRWASRITLEVVSVRVERLNEIYNKDAEAEGACCWADSLPYDKYEAMHRNFGTWPAPSPRQAFGCLWESINGEGSWDANPWVWVISFKRLEPTP